MMNLNFFIMFYLFLISCFMLMFYLKYLLMILIIFEFILVMVYCNMYLIYMWIEVNLFIMLYLLVMGVCEGALGLSLIVMIIRSYGNDYLSSLNLMKW